MVRSEFTALIIFFLFFLLFFYQKNLIKSNTCIIAGLLGKTHKEWKSCLVINISREGMGIELSLQERIPINSILQIEIIVPEKEKPVTAIGVLRWIKNLEKNGGFLGGVDLTQIDSRDKWILLNFAYDEWEEEL